MPYRKKPSVVILVQGHTVGLTHAERTSWDECYGPVNDGGVNSPAAMSRQVFLKDEQKGVCHSACPIFRNVWAGLQLNLTKSVGDGWHTRWAQIAAPNLP